MAQRGGWIMAQFNITLTKNIRTDFFVYNEQDKMFFKLIIIASCLKSHLFHSSVYSKPQAAWLVGIKGILSFLNMILKKRGHCIACV